MSIFTESIENTPMKFKLLSVVVLLSAYSSAWSLEAYQGNDYPVSSWRCGAPIVEALRKNDPDGLLNDPSGKLLLKESLETISQSNLNYMKSKLLPLSSKEQALVDLISTDYEPSIVHRTSLDSSRVILQNGGIVSATKRKAPSVHTPGIEQQLFSGHDCVFAAVAPPYGTQDYGTTIMRFKDKTGFAWGTMLTGYTWTREVAKRSITDPATSWMKTAFARLIFTNNHWDEALALQIIQHVRGGTSIRGKGASYDKNTILDELLQAKDRTTFWQKVVRHRLAYFEGKYTDNVDVDDMLFVQFRTMDGSTVRNWGLPAAWFTGNPYSFIQYFNRSL
jgi:hypothetical protein